MFPAHQQSKTIQQNSESEDIFYRLDFFKGQLVSVVWYLKSQCKHIKVLEFIAVQLAANVFMLLQCD